MHVYLHAITWQMRRQLGEHFFSSSVWVLGIELRLTGLVPSVLFWGGAGGWDSTQSWDLLGKCFTPELYSGVSSCCPEVFLSRPPALLTNAIALCRAQPSRMQGVWKLFHMVE